MKRTLAVLAVGMMASGLMTAPAWASDVATRPLASDAATAQQIATFWLGDGAANLKNATPYNVQTAVDGNFGPPQDLASDTKGGQVAPLAPSASGSPDNKMPAMGKVFFVASDGQPHWCTGAAIQSKYRNMVATAGHCVYNTEGYAVTLEKWIFVPGYADGATPWGLYVGRQAFTHYDWQVYTDYARDFAFANVFNGVVASSTGELADVGRLGDNVGGQGFAYNQGVGDTVNVFGYPAGPHPDGKQPFTGETLESSSGPLFRVAVPSLISDGVGVDSKFTGAGSLGSPWLSHYSDELHKGYINGITISVADTDGDLHYDTSVSPYFDGETAAIYSASSARWTGSMLAP